MTNGDRIRSMTDEELSGIIGFNAIINRLEELLEKNKEDASHERGEN